MTTEQKKYIDDASYGLLVAHYKWGYVGDPIFQDEAGEHFLRSLEEKRKRHTQAEIMRISKAVDWIAQDHTRK